MSKSRKVPRKDAVYYHSVPDTSQTRPGCLTRVAASRIVRPRRQVFTCRRPKWFEQFHPRGHLMKLRFSALISIAAALLCAVALADEGAEKIFDGKSLEGWKGNDKFWSVKDGAIT